MIGSENHEPPRFIIEVIVPRGGWTLSVLQLHHGATLQSVFEATVDLHCKTVCYNLLFHDVNMFTKVGPPLPPLIGIHWFLYIYILKMHS